jgi:hypothetical protein
VRRHRLGGQESSGSVETLIEGLAACDLIVDATADGRASGYVAAAAAAGKKPVVWAEIFGGGFGGLIARHRPAQEPDPASMRGIIESWCREQGKPLEPAIDYETRDKLGSWIADDADVSVIAAHAARMAIDVLVGREPSAFPHSVYMIGLAKWWIFEEPFDTLPVPVGTPASVPDEPVDEGVQQEESAFVGTMIKRFVDANSADHSDRPASAT